MTGKRRAAGRAVQLLRSARERLSQGRPVEALRCCEQALERAPLDLQVRAGLGDCFAALGRFAEAEACFRGIVARDPANAGALYALGTALAAQNRWHDAIVCREQLARLTGTAEANATLGDALARGGRFEDALRAYDRAIALNPLLPYAHFSKAVKLFSRGRMSEGLAGYRYRRARRMFQERHPGTPLRDEIPPDLAGQRILLIGEQGLGDEIFFLRHAHALKSRGAVVVYHGDPRLRDILVRCGTIDEFAASPAPPVSADYAMMIGDLLALSPGYPPPLALAPHTEATRAVGGKLAGLGPPPYLGLTWRAGTSDEGRPYASILYKEIPLSAFADGVRAFPGTCLALQRLPRAGEIAALGAALGRPVHDLSSLNDDLESMLALLAVVDEYVGVSSTNMHLRAGAGRTARVLVPSPAEWRWMDEGDESPWFPGFRVYRQAPDGGWGGALARLAWDLRR